MSKHRQDNVIEGEAIYTIPDFDAVDAFGRLLLGISLEGVEQFFARLKQMEERLFDSAEYTNVAANETPVDQLRYLLVGAMFLSQRHMRKRVGQSLRVAAALTSLLRPAAQRVNNNWFIRQGRGLISAEVERLIGEGRLQEKNARRVARNLLGASIEEVAAYLHTNQTLDLLLKRPTQFSQQQAGLAHNLHATLDELATSIVDQLNAPPSQKTAADRAANGSKHIHPDDR